MLHVHTVGRVIVSKVFLGHSVPIKEGELVNRRVYPRAASVYRSVHTKHRGTSHTQDFFFFFNSACSCFFFFLSLHLDGLHTTIPKGRKWFVFDNELVLPEYMICFEYLTGVSGSIGISSLFLSDPVINTIWIIECFQ